MSSVHKIFMRTAQPQEAYAGEYLSPLGPLFYLVGSGGQVISLGFTALSRGIPGYPVMPDSHNHAAPLVCWLTAYFNGQPAKKTLTVSVNTSAFRLQVWRLTLAIPFGSTSTYREIAARTVSPRAVRAAGTALGKNPLALVIPCHRVVGNGGLLGGYSGGLNLKKKLLEWEKNGRH